MSRVLGSRRSCAGLLVYRFSGRGRINEFPRRPESQVRFPKAPSIRSPVVQNPWKSISTLLSAGGSAVLITLLSLGSPVPAQAQGAPPPNMVADEMERSRSCVPVLSQLEALNLELDPLSRRADRIEALYQAVALEDSMRVAPFDEARREDRLVREWFEADGDLAREYVESEDEALLEERRRLRGELEEELEQAFREINQEADEILGEDEDFFEALGSCDGAILVREAVLEACGSDGTSTVCREAGDGDVDGAYRFVESAEDLWDVEQLRPWTNPSGIGPRPDGGLGGASTGTVARRGNVRLALALEPMLLERSEVSPEEEAEYDAHLEAMGFEWDNPRFVMAPAVVVSLDIDRPLAGETHYLLHFEDLSDPASQVFWSAQADVAGPIQGGFPASDGVLARLMSGDEVSLTAVRLTDEDDMEGDVLYSLGFTTVGQAEAVTALLSYLVEGQFSEDLDALFPADG